LVSIDEAPAGDVTPPRLWTLTAQRRKSFDGRPANLGALPVKEKKTKNVATFLVPMLKGEEIWIAFDLPALATVAGTFGGAAIRMVPLHAPFRGRFIVAAQGIERGAAVHPLAAPAISPISEENGLAPQFEFELNFAGNGTERVRVALTTTELFTRLSGQSLPKEGSFSDAYGGWRLP
jgi:hypothetical protein